MSTYSKGEPPRINSGSELALRAEKEKAAKKVEALRREIATLEKRI